MLTRRRVRTLLSAARVVNRTKDSLSIMPGDRCEKTAGSNSSGSISNDIWMMSSPQMWAWTKCALNLQSVLGRISY